MKYVKVILPFALEGTFTYSIPSAYSGQIEQGKRVLVQFGKKRIYTAIVAELFAELEAEFKLKPVLAVLDEKPLLNAKLLHFWQWMHKYYMCPIGDVMRAALPSALKLSSETLFYLSEYYETDKADLSPQEIIICECLSKNKALTLSELESKSGQKNVWQLVQKLLKSGLLITEENIAIKYKAKLEKHLRLSDAYDGESLSELFEHLQKKAHKQADLLSLIIEKIEAGETLVQRDLLKESDASLASLKSLEKKGIVEIYEVKVDRLALFEGANIEAETQEFSEAQENAHRAIKIGWQKHSVALLHGITGSGKTHIYIKLIAEILATGKQALYLLPEIALTTQIIKKLQAVFGKKVGIYHSGFSDAERVEIWNKVDAGEYELVLAARSGLFLPFRDLGLIIIDEEQDSSYKQYDPAPRYQARDSAMYLASIHQAKVLMGTATPSLESYENALSGKYAYVPLSQRFGTGELPEIRILDIQKLQKNKEMSSYFSHVLLQEIEAALARKEQVILFQNKRGYAPYVRFQEQNEVPMCPQCDVSLTYHRLNADLRCHYCGFKATVAQICKRYGASDMQVMSFGTEQVEEEMIQRFPDAKIERLDLDNTRRKNAHAEIIRKFETGETDILVGTQMLSKGLDFDSVSLVAVLQADHILRFPDFRAAERAYQLMEQVSGRAGRKKANGQVLIQTSLPDHFVLETLINRNAENFYAAEFQQRKEFSYPPYFRLIKIGMKHRDSALLWQAASALDKIIRSRLEGILLGPAPPIVSRIKNQYLLDFILKSPKDPRYNAANKAVLVAAAAHLRKQKGFSAVQVYFDVDP